ncbi:hypothetical protein [Pseudomonas sp. MWU12-2323]|uniref:hypothetical protein n=1 Tax=Pseudomonas sp. MWU12-2323 TaxID=2651296 RepID=UPI00128E2148|nr:hypothetical protein [Pseudomonas sp. MWU12-2323]MPQ71459.1 hypothetical protein [Pseudomonas sp. MWU12-2323]
MKTAFAIAALLLSGMAHAAGDDKQSASAPGPAPAAAEFIAQFYSVEPKDVDVNISSLQGSEATAITSAPSKGNCSLKMVRIPNSAGGSDWLFAGGLSCDKAAGSNVNG